MFIWISYPIEEYYLNYILSWKFAFDPKTILKGKLGESDAELLSKFFNAVSYSPSTVYSRDVWLIEFCSSISYLLLIFNLDEFHYERFNSFII